MSNNSLNLPFLAGVTTNETLPAPYINGGTAIDLSSKEDKANKGIANGYAPLDATGKVPEVNLPDTASLDAEVDTKVSAHNSDTTAVHGITDTSNLNSIIAGNGIYLDPEDGEAGGAGGTINIRGGNGSDEVGGNAGSINLKGGDGTGGEGGNGGSILLVGGQDKADAGSINLSSATSIGSGGSIISIGSGNYNGGTLNMSAESGNGNGGSINTSNKGGSINTSGYDAKAGGSLNLSAGDSGTGGFIDGKNKGGFIKFYGTGTNLNGIGLGAGGSINISAGPHSAGYPAGQGPIGNTSGVGGNGGSIQLLGGAGGEEATFGNGGTGGTIIGNGGAAITIGQTAENEAILATGYNAGTINFSAGSVGAGGSIDTSDGGGSINISGGVNGVGGSIDTSDGGGSINTWAGGYINTSDGGGYINTYDGGGYINTSEDGGLINTSVEGGSINTSNGGGSINTSGSDASGGSINTSAGISNGSNGGTGGSINTSGGEGNNEGVGGAGGTLQMQGGNGNEGQAGLAGGSINTSNGGGYIYTGGGGVGGGIGGSINTSGDDEYGNGGSINTSGSGSNAGGSIDTSNGGGSINTQGVGSIGLGVSGTRTTLNGSATTEQTITLPDETGTIALTSDSRFTDARTPTAHTHAISDVTNLQTKLDTKQEYYYTPVTYASAYTIPSTLSDTGSIERHFHFTVSGTPTFPNNYINFPTTGKLGDIITITNSRLKIDGFLNNVAMLLREKEGTDTSNFGSLEVGTTQSYVRKSSNSAFGNWTYLHPAIHTHGNINEKGAVGTTANLPLITTTSGVVTTGTFGTTANTFCQGNDSRLSDLRTPTSHTHGNITNDGKIPIFTTSVASITAVGSLDALVNGQYVITQGANVAASAVVGGTTGAKTITLTGSVGNGYANGSATINGSVGLGTSGSANVNITIGNSYAYGQPLMTGNNGVVGLSSFGTTAYTFCQGNDVRLGAKTVFMLGGDERITYALGGSYVYGGQITRGSKVSGGFNQTGLHVLGNWTITGLTIMANYPSAGTAGVTYSLVKITNSTTATPLWTAPAQNGFTNDLSSISTSVNAPLSDGDKICLMLTVGSTVGATVPTNANPTTITANVYCVPR